MVRKKLAMVRVPLDNKELDKVLDGVIPRSQVPVYDAFTELYESLAPMHYFWRTWDYRALGII